MTKLTKVGTVISVQTNTFSCHTFNLGLSMISKQWQNFNC